MFHHTIPGLDHPNVLSYIDVLRRDANVGDRFAIIGAEGIGFDANRRMEDWELDGTNKAREEAAAAFGGVGGCSPFPGLVGTV